MLLSILLLIIIILIKMPSEIYYNDIPNFIKSITNCVSKVKELISQKKKENEYKALSKVYKKEREKFWKQYNTTEI